MRSLVALASAIVLTIGVAGPAMAADSATVSAHISVDAPCLTVNTATVDFGHLPFSTGILQTRNEPLSYTNCSAIGEKVFAHGSNATGPGGVAQWTLAGNFSDCGSVALDRFQILAVKPDRSSVNLSTSDLYLEDVPSTAPGDYAMLGLVMPCSGSSGVGVTMDFQVTYTATF